jgi:uncharacterized membrane protein YqjE
MSTRLMMLLVVTAAFGVLTAIALADVGYLGLFEPHFQSWGGGQVLADLAILAVLGCIWMVVDSRKSGVNAWPFVVLTLAAGSFGVLFYLIRREVVGATHPATSTSRVPA